MEGAGATRQSLGPGISRPGEGQKGGWEGAGPSKVPSGTASGPRDTRVSKRGSERPEQVLPSLPPPSQRGRPCPCWGRRTKGQPACWAAPPCPLPCTQPGGEDTRGLLACPWQLWGPPQCRRPTPVPRMAESCEDLTASQNTVGSETRRPRAGSSGLSDEWAGVPRPFLGSKKLQSRGSS